ncbi:MAG TPA: DinB family protein [Gemmatimonadaceae bacterium]|nr:DinB family protein [Gemmatimonadaceae bacterium]
MPTPEPWLRGPVPGVPPLLQPVAHALQLAVEDVRRVVPPLTRGQLGARPGGAASVAFHVTHAAGSLDRLFTYARGEMLDERQMAALRAERAEGPDGADAPAVAATFEAQVERAMDQLRATDASTLLDAREVGRARLPSTVLGLLFHAAEHTQRHVGQAITTARVVSAD